MAMIPNPPPGVPMDPMGMPPAGPTMGQMPMEQPQQAGDTEMLVAELAQHAGRVREIVGQLNSRGIDIESALASAAAVEQEPDPLGGAGLPPENGLGGNTGVPPGLLEGLV